VLSEVGPVVEALHAARRTHGRLQADPQVAQPPRVVHRPVGGLRTDLQQIAAEVREGMVVIAFETTDRGGVFVHEQVVHAGVDLLLAPAEQVVEVGRAG